ncbi:peptide ABC transporter permease [Candidatus Epulonipiscium fishelsonii]|uniref:Peptide ABC transporter permease n=1 Tax=Candidatus Epulonipiscium fishelsonii TaxID=77094 RepID=A0ACC8XF68_9FIRM|nr:peptide ABC transporter permease [Epulopiscium sp. SCG-B05WGA-EpuloA1]ONI41924.1 peptide ABC transporter permease [Epulopiscium sp. SCG-B11WGA-EpuloA1]
MIKFICKRLLAGILSLFILATITFFTMRIIPGSPFGQEGIAMSPQVAEALNKKYALDKSLPEQYLIYLQNALQGDFGESIKRPGMDVTYIISRGAPSTIKLGFYAFSFAMVVGLTLGIISALTKKRWLQGIITFIATLGVSIPSFLMAMLLMIIFGVTLKLFPLVGLNTPKHYVLPTISLAIYPISVITRLTRSSLRDVMNKDYITLARSKGSKELVVIIKHGLKNALLPIVTYSGPLIAYLMTGSFVIESLFSIPGIGSEFVNSITNRDYTLIMGMSIFFGSLVIITSLLADIVSAIVDPRIKLKV